MKIRFLVLSFFVLNSLISSAQDSTQTLESRLFAIENSISDPKQLEILASSSPQVLYLEKSNREAVAAARVALQTKSWVKLEWNKNEKIISHITLITQPQPTAQASKIKKWNPGLYSPSILRSFVQVENLFKSVDSYTDVDLSDNCFARAHYWSRAFEVENGIKSMKVFVLFTPLYRNEHNFRWWYHVAPYVSLQGTEGEERIVIDPSYEDAPKDIKAWVFHFASKAGSCRIVRSISEYHETVSLGGCVVITASMFHYSPQDLDPINPPVGWRCDDLLDVQKALRAPAPYQVWEDYTSFMPDHCL